MVRKESLVPAAITVSGQVTGTPGNDDYQGSTGNDTMLMQQGGDDTLFGDDGSDGFYFGAAFNALDKVDGGAGIDTLALQGPYSGSTTNLSQVSNTEVVLLLSGSDTRFGDNANNRYSYNLTSIDGNVAAGQILTLQATGLLPGENIVFDGSAESDGGFRIYPGQGVDVLKGGAGSDGFFFGADHNLSGRDQIDGGAGVDSIALRGNYVGTGRVVFTDSSFAHIEVLAILSSHTNEYGGTVSPDGFDYDIVTADGNVAAGQRLDVIAARLGSDESLIFDGSAELDGTFRVISGAGNDTIHGSQGNDVLFGGAGFDFLYAENGSDYLDGGAGGDVLYFGANLDSNDSANGGADVDQLWIGGRDYTDADFSGVTGMESVAIITAGNSYVFADKAQQAGIMSIGDVSSGANIIDATAYHDYLVLGISGGAGGDLLAGGSGYENLYIYNHRTDSYGNFKDQIYGFVSGFDVIDATFMSGETNGAFQMNFVGNFSSEFSAELALPFNFGKLNAAFVTSTHTLWFDLNNDRQFDDHDLSIILVGVNSLRPEDVKHGAFVIG